MASRGRAAFWARKRSAAATTEASAAASAGENDEGDDGIFDGAGQPSTPSAALLPAVPPPPPKPKPQRSLASYGFKVPSSAPSSSSPARPPPPAKTASAAMVPPAPKKPRVDQGGGADARRTKETHEGDGGAGPSCASAPPPSSSKVLRDPDTGLPLSRDERFHERWQRKVAADELERKRGAEKALQVQQQQQQTLAPTKATPLELQVAALQRANPGTILLFEVGYKFVIFGRDAEITAPILRLFAYCERGQLRASFPVPSLPKSVRKLVAAGHAVGVVRQTETAALKKASSERSGPFERKLTAIFTAATVDAGGEDDVGGDFAAGSSSHSFSTHGCGASAFLLIVADAPTGAEDPEEAQNNDDDDSTSSSDLISLGLAAFDAASGDARWACLDDGTARSALERALLTTAPAEIACVEPLSAATARAVDAYAATRPGLRVTEIKTGSSSSASASAAREALTRFFYPSSATNNAARSADDETSGRKLLSSLPGAAVRALAAGVRRLDDSKLAAPLSALGPAGALRELEPDGTLALPPNVLAALEILMPSSGGSVAPSKEGGEGKSARASSVSSSSSSQQGSLLWLVDRAKTRAGRRTLRDWLSRPLADAAAASARHDAVEEIIEASSSEAPPLAGLAAFLSRAPDLERGLARCLLQTASPAEFVATMRFIEEAAQKLGVLPSSPSKTKAASSFAPSVSSPLLRSLLSDVASEAARAAVASALAPHDTSPAVVGGSNNGNTFDRVLLLACPATFPETAACKAAVASSEASLASLLPQLRREAGIASLEFVSVHNQGTHLLELPANSSRIPPAWVHVCGTKKVNRFLAPSVDSALRGLAVAKEKLAAAASREWARHLGSLAPSFSVLRKAATSAAALDALVAFAESAISEGWSRPRFVVAGDSCAQPPPPPPPTLRLCGLVHPMLAASARAAGKSAVANDLELGGGAYKSEREETSSSSSSNPRLLILTGPNAGGKSCIARAAALAVVLAQAGSFVSAESAELTAFDAAFTRMGAADSLLQGRSTFLEEMAEAASIARAASRFSLIIFDELGRGTSTRDGAALAAAMARFAAQRLQCVTIFITHYPEVADLAKELPERATAGYMDCIERQDDGTTGEGEGNENGQRPTSSLVPHITFLYKLVRVVAKRSFGLNVARLAGLPEKVVAAAARRAAALEEGGGGGSGGKTDGSRENKIVTSARSVAEAASAALASGDAASLLEAARAAKEALEE